MLPTHLNWSIHMCRMSTPCCIVALLHCVSERLTEKGSFVLQASREDKGLGSALWDPEGAERAI